MNKISESEENLSSEQEDTDTDIIEDENSDSDNSKDANPFYVSSCMRTKMISITMHILQKFDETSPCTGFM